MNMTSAQISSNKPISNNCSATVSRCGSGTVKVAVIPAAGFGSRLLPATKSVPKEMLTIVDRPAIDYVIAEAFDAGIEHVVIILSRNKQSIENHFDRHPELEYALQQAGKTDLLDELKERLPESDRISFVRQHDALGLGHAIWCARYIVGNEPFAVMLPDMLYAPGTNGLAQLIECVKARGGSAIGVNQVPIHQVSQYGIVDLGPEGNISTSPEPHRIIDLIEKPEQDKAPSRWAVIGRYVLQPEVLYAIKKTAPECGGEIQLTNAIKLTINETPTWAVPASAPCYDCGNAESFLNTNIAFALARDSMRHKMSNMINRFASQLGISDNE